MMRELYKHTLSQNNSAVFGSDPSNTFFICHSSVCIVHMFRLFKTQLNNKKTLSFKLTIFSNQLDYILISQQLNPDYP